MPQAVLIPIALIHFHPRNEEFCGRKPESWVRGLADDIKVNGLHEPICLRLDEATGSYLCLSGEHRIRAVTLLGWTAIPAYLITPENPLAFLVSRNHRRRNPGYSKRLVAYKEFCPEFFTATKITRHRFDQISALTGIAVATLKADLKKIWGGANSDLSIEELRALWEEKQVKNLKIQVTDLSGGQFLLIVAGKNLKYEWRGKFRTIIRESAEAARSRYFDKNFKKENADIANRIRQLRKEAGLTQFQLGQLLGYSQSYIAELEGGKWECTASLFEQIVLTCEERLR